MRIKIDRDACQTAAICLQYQLDNSKMMYELDEESIAVLKTSDGGDSAHPNLSQPLVDDEGWVELEDVAGYDPARHDEMTKIVLESARACPFNAIIVESDDGETLWPEEI